VQAFSALTRMIAERKGIGDTLAEGTYRAALRISKLKGVDVLPYAVVAKGIGVGAHGIRSKEDYPGYESYTCSVQGGDHTSVARLPIDHGDSELRALLYDSGVFCWFNFFEKEARDLLWGFLEAVTGLRISAEEWFNLTGRRIIHLQRALMLLGGPDVRWTPNVHDDVPARWYEPLGQGPFKGMAVTREKIEEARKEYYGVIGWDENGIPKSEELRRVGLTEVDKRIRSFRREP